LKHLRSIWAGRDDNDDDDDDDDSNPDEDPEEDPDESTTNGRLILVERKLTKLDALLMLVAQKLNIDVTAVTKNNGQDMQGNSDTETARGANGDGKQSEELEVEMGERLNANTDNHDNDHTMEANGDAGSDIGDNLNNDSARREDNGYESDMNGGQQDVEEPDEMQADQGDENPDSEGDRDRDEDREFDD